MQKTISSALLILLLVTMFAFVFKIQPVKAIGSTIYINADGSITPSDAPIQPNGDLIFFSVLYFRNHIVR